MKNQYFLTAYGPQIRQSNKCVDATAAALYCWGVTNRVTTLAVGGRRTLSVFERLQNQQRLAERHFAMTGNKTWDSTYQPPEDFPYLKTLADLHQIADLLTADPPKGKHGLCRVVATAGNVTITHPLKNDLADVYALEWDDGTWPTRYAFNHHDEKFLGFVG